MQSPELVAHRGWAKNYPENTLVAIESAIECGARFVEIDVQLSSDLYPVLFHDRTLERMCGAKAAVHECSLLELRALTCGEAERFGDRFASEGIASLAGFIQLLRRHPDVRAFVEIKRVAIQEFGDDRVLDRVMTAIAPAISQCALISFSHSFLATVRKQQAIPLGAVFDKWTERESSVVRDLAPEYAFFDLEGLPATGALRVDGARVVVYEVDDPKLAVALARRGVDLVETFAIGEMLESLAKMREGQA